MGCESRFWVSWARVLGRSLVEFGWWVEFGSAFYSLVCWLVEFVSVVAVGVVAAVDIGGWWLCC